MINIKINNRSRGLEVVIGGSKQDKLVAIIVIKNRLISKSLLNTLVNLDYLSLGITKTNISADDIFSKISSIVSNMYLKKRWSISFTI